MRVCCGGSNLGINVGGTHLLPYLLPVNSRQTLCLVSTLPYDTRGGQYLTLPDLTFLRRGNKFKSNFHGDPSPPPPKRTSEVAVAEYVVELCIHNFDYCRKYMRVAQHGIP